MNGELKRFLLTSAPYGAQNAPVVHIETHISDVFLAGNTALKIKKSVRLPFLDFSSLEARRAMCEREVILNRRYAPALYDGVVSIGRTAGGFTFNGGGEVIEYGVKMRRFRAEDLWSHRAATGALRDEDIIHLVRSIADFHRRAEPRPAWGGFDTVRKTILANIDELPADHRIRAFGGLKSCLEETLQRHRGLIEERRASHVRAIHGDLHLGNIAFLDGAPIPFDGIEFSDELGSGDVWSDVAFLAMDLRAHHLPDLANRAVNLYLEESDDFGGLPLLALYTAHRAVVRAKVHLLTGTDNEDTEIVDRYLDTAGDALAARPVRVIAIGGLSGSGKSTVARALATRLDGVVVRTDVVRKHVVGLRPLDRAPDTAYTEDISQAVYRGLIERARAAAPRGGTIILDGVHREGWQREASERFAAEIGAPFTGIWCSVPKEVALQRIEARTNDASNADRGVIERQYSTPPAKVGWRVVDTAVERSVAFSRTLEGIGSFLGVTPLTIDRSPGVATGECGRPRYRRFE